MHNDLLQIDINIEKQHKQFANVLNEINDFSHLYKSINNSKNTSSHFFQFIRYIKEGYSKDAIFELDVMNNIFEYSDDDYDNDYNDDYDNFDEYYELGYNPFENSYDEYEQYDDYDEQSSKLSEDTEDKISYFKWYYNEGVNC
jgi:hypothetical protein